MIFDKKTVVSFYRDGLQLDTYGTRQELISRLRKHTDAVLTECLYISPKIRVKDFLEAYYRMSTTTQTSVVHGDFHYDNIFGDGNNNRFGVIDFSEGGIEDPALDFMYMCYYPEKFREAVFEEYGSTDSNLYERSQMYDRIYGLYDMIETI